jgi:hypothetical protein
MQVVLKVWSSNPEYSGGCDYAVLEMDEGLAKLMLRRITSLCEQRAVDDSLFEAYYWDSSPAYFSPWVNRASESGEVQDSDGKLEEMLASLEVDTREMVTAPPDFRVPEGQFAAVECSQMIVRDDGISFIALLRHTDICVTTAEISKAFIESVLGPITA